MALNHLDFIQETSLAFPLIDCQLVLGLHLVLLRSFFGKHLLSKLSSQKAFLLQHLHQLPRTLKMYYKIRLFMEDFIPQPAYPFPYQVQFTLRLLTQDLITPLLHHLLQLLPLPVEVM